MLLIGDAHTSFPLILFVPQGRRLPHNRSGMDEALFKGPIGGRGRETVLQMLQAECEWLPGRPEDYLPYQRQSLS